MKNKTPVPTTFENSENNSQYSTATPNAYKESAMFAIKKLVSMFFLILTVFMLTGTFNVARAGQYNSLNCVQSTYAGYQSSEHGIQNTCSFQIAVMYCAKSNDGTVAAGASLCSQSANSSMNLGAGQSGTTGFSSGTRIFYVACRANDYPVLTNAGQSGFCRIAGTTNTSQGNNNSNQL